MLRKALAATALTALILSAGCDSSQKRSTTETAKTDSQARAQQVEAPAKTERGAEVAALVKPGEAKVGDTTWCLASGEVFTVEADAPSVEYEGKTYYFCCEGCDEDFMANPAKLLETQPDRG